MALGKSLGFFMTVLFDSSTAKNEGTKAQAVVEIPSAKFVHPVRDSEEDPMSGFPKAMASRFPLSTVTSFFHTI
eukprot:CAMPEP_0118637198 /NCGR_PEP_ID=MMETSP0785-20121206/3025_1 /TAXON_ID=91992 /ORGANISM="Bolidomonas pacifica, Strain CCMP 1866" /LENGTH=73 /DNA_ID=CAMNT_0006528369 /DNA_START=656 /DNA_END=877 /DNA_ORIENTATION=-